MLPYMCDVMVANKSTSMTIELFDSCLYAYASGEPVYAGSPYLEDCLNVIHESSNHSMEELISPTTKLRFVRGPGPFAEHYRT